MTSIYILSQTYSEAPNRFKEVVKDYLRLNSVEEFKCIYSRNDVILPLSFNPLIDQQEDIDVNDMHGERFLMFNEIP